MVDEQPAFQVLARARERDAEKVGAAARAREANRGHGSHDLTAHGHVHEPVGCIPADRSGVRGQLDRPRVAVVDRDQLQRGTVAEHDLDVACDLDRAPVVEHHCRPCVWSDVDDVMDISRPAGADPLQHDRLDDVGAGIYLYVQPARGACMASALTRRPERAPRRRNGAMDGVTTSTPAPAGTWFVPSITPSGTNGSKNRRILANGVKRHSSSRPDGSSKASGSREVNRSGGLPVAGRPWEYRGVGEGHLSQQLLPSAAR